MTLDPYLAVRASTVYGTAVATAAVWIWRRPARASIVGAALAFAWNVPIVAIVNVVAMRLGFWHFDAHGGLFLSIPIDLYLAWAWLWGAVVALAFPSVSLGVVAIGALVVDAAAMPLAAPVVRLEPFWLVCDALGIAAAVIPSQLLARWTARREHLAARATLQVIAFAAFLLFLLPAIALDASGSEGLRQLARPAWQLSAIAQVVAVPAVIGLTAVQEFVTRGGGTPVPFDPPRRLVTSGIYSYIRNPMQLSAVVTLVLLGIIIRNPWVAASGIGAHIYSVGLAGWDEGEDLRRRFDGAWLDYRRHVRAWLPRLRPWHPPGSPTACLYVAASCDVCRGVAEWFGRRRPQHLAIVPAESHPSHVLTRVTYEPGDGSRPSAGIAAIARALEHVHFGWALVGFTLRLPIVCPLVQLLADASGAQPRALGAVGAVPRR